MKLGTIVALKDGRIGTVVYNSLIGVGIKWGVHCPKEEDFEGTTGNTLNDQVSEDWEWEPEALLRDPWDGCRSCGFEPDECVGRDYVSIDTSEQAVKER